MATTNIPKGAGRATAAARTRKHAQRTPLPPKKGSPGAEAIAERRDRTMPMTDQDTGLIAFHTRKDERTGGGAVESREEAPDGRSHTKGAAFAEKAGALGWEAATEVRGDAVEVTATRGAETVVQAWAGGLWQYDASVYAYGDRTTKPRNASGALKLLARSEADASAEAAKVHSNRSFRKAEPKDIGETLEKAQKALPFDPELATDEEITGVMAGQAIVWYNRIGRSNESAIVGRKGVRITRLPDGARVANFCCPVTGYRSCLVTAILRVGRGKSLVTVGAESAKVEVS